MISASIEKSPARSTLQRYGERRERTRASSLRCRLVHMISIWRSRQQAAPRVLSAVRQGARAQGLPPLETGRLRAEAGSARTAVRRFSTMRKRSRLSRRGCSGL